MKMERLSSGAFLLTTPLAAHAAAIPDTGLYSLIGGAVGGFVGALVACWFCKRIGSKGDRDPRK